MHYNCYYNYYYDVHRAYEAAHVLWQDGPGRDPRDLV